MSISITTLTDTNIEKEHICCAISDVKCRAGYNAKKRWLQDQFRDGYKFKKVEVRGKAFIEYVPAENAWVPLVAPGYLLINCFWVSGQHKGKGYGKALYLECENEAKMEGKNGIVVVTGNSKQAYMSDRRFFQNQGFELCDTAQPYFELWYKSLNENIWKPEFRDCCKTGECDVKEGLAVYYTDACPFTGYYTEELERMACEKGYKISKIKLESREMAQNHFSPHTIYSLFQDGKFLTHQILNEKSFEKLLGGG
ncbi:N-acetyltransferase [Pararcticibacter amylolyticus]|nr:N-acetyltransferase [Pararcticibacter amylolyticus]